jgi:mannose-6-phosphate isomerase-like protein (cupin superfamily)
LGGETGDDVRSIWFIPEEASTMQVHKVDHVLIFISGKGLTTVAGMNQEVEAGDIVIVDEIDNE